MTRKNSKKRQAVLDCLRGRKDNPTVEMLYQSLKPDYPELSLGTVYRNLGVLVQEGQAVSIGNVYGQERFDGRLDPHPHFVCRCCRRVIDLQLPDTVSALFDSMDEAMGYQPECYMLTIKGLCPDCRSVGTDKTEAKKKQYKEDMTVRKWICKVCGNVHEGDAPPELCPVCKVPGSKFVQPGEMPEVEPLFNEEDLSAEELDKAIRLGRGAEGETRTWVCGVCGHVHEGTMPPELCPVCKVTGSKFSAE